MYRSNTLAATLTYSKTVKSCNIGAWTEGALQARGLECSLDTDTTTNIPPPLLTSRYEVTGIGLIESSRVTTAEVGRARWQDDAPWTEILYCGPESVDLTLLSRE